MYNFACESCDKRFEELVSFSRRDQVRCPVCGGETRVLVSGFAVQGGGSSSGGGSAPVRSSGFS